MRTSVYSLPDYPYTAVSSGDHYSSVVCNKNGLCIQTLPVCDNTLIAMPPQDLGLINLPTSLENVKVKSMPNSAYYIADFISEVEEEIILNKVGISGPTLHQSRLSNRMTDWQSIRLPRLLSLAGKCSHIVVCRRGQAI